MRIIIKSGKLNWSGKEFSEYPAKIYTSYEEAVDAINNHHFWTIDYVKNEYVKVEKFNRIVIIPLRENRYEKLLAAEKIRW